MNHAKITLILTIIGTVVGVVSTYLFFQDSKKIGDMHAVLVARGEAPNRD